MRRPTREQLTPVPPGVVLVDDVYRMWWSTLVTLNDQYHMELNFHNWTLAGKSPDFGLLANRWSGVEQFTHGIIHQPDR